MKRHRRGALSRALAGVRGGPQADVPCCCRARTPRLQRSIALPKPFALLLAFGSAESLSEFFMSSSCAHGVLADIALLVALAFALRFHAGTRAYLRSNVAPAWHSLA